MLSSSNSANRPCLTAVIVTFLAANWKISAKHARDNGLDYSVRPSATTGHPVTPSVISKLTLYNVIVCRRCFVCLLASVVHFSAVPRRPCSRERDRQRRASTAIEELKNTQQAHGPIVTAPLPPATRTSVLLLSDMCDQGLFIVQLQPSHAQTIRQAFPLYVLKHKKKTSAHTHTLRSLNARMRLALRPFGGSFVILIPFCSTATGKRGLGLEVSQSRNSAWVSSGTAFAFSRICSSVGSQETARWQFCRHTQSPFSLSRLKNWSR